MGNILLSDSECDIDSNFSACNFSVKCFDQSILDTAFRINLKKSCLPLTYYVFYVLSYLQYRHNLNNDIEYFHLIQQYHAVFLHVVANDCPVVMAVGNAACAVFPEYDGAFHPSSILGNHTSYQWHLQLLLYWSHGQQLPD